MLSFVLIYFHFREKKIKKLIRIMNDMLKRIPFYSAFGISSVVDDARISASSKR